jgi:peptide deformylase
MANEIRTYPDPVLLKEARPVTDEEFSSGMIDGVSLNTILDDMMTALASSKGVGLAAPQIGVSIRLFMIDLRDGNLPRVFINPKVECAGKLVSGDEGCLSVPGLFVKVKRHPACTVNAKAPDGKPFALKMEGLAARACQHENDHLSGLLFIHRMGIAVAPSVRRSLEVMERTYKEWQKHLASKKPQQEAPPGGVVLEPSTVLKPLIPQDTKY